MDAKDAVDRIMRLIPKPKVNAVVVITTKAEKEKAERSNEQDS